MAEQKFAPGDVVRLNLPGSPLMSVQSHGGVLVECVWFVGNVLHREYIDADCLVKVDRKEELDDVQQAVKMLWPGITLQPAQLEVIRSFGPTWEKEVKPPEPAWDKETKPLIKIDAPPLTPRQFEERVLGSLYDDLTDSSRRVMQLANQEAQRFNHEYIATEHVLVGLVKEGGGAQHVLTKMLGGSCTGQAKILKAVRDMVQLGPAKVVVGKLPLTPNVALLLKHARQWAKILNGGCVATEHLLLGLLETRATACAALASVGLKILEVRAAVLGSLGKGEVAGSQRWVARFAQV